MNISSALPYLSSSPNSAAGTQLRANGVAPSSSASSSTASTNARQEDLSPEQEKQVQELKARDQEVRAHEQAHATVGGPYAGSPQYQYTTGPDGKRYATGGEVPIDASAVPNNPDATIRKMDIVIRAALAPAEPSAQDKQVAQQAQQTKLQAQAEKQEAAKQGDENGNSASATGSASSIIETLIAEARQQDTNGANNTQKNNADAPLASINNAVSEYIRASQLG